MNLIFQKALFCSQTFTEMRVCPPFANLVMLSSYLFARPWSSTNQDTSSPPLSWRKSHFHQACLRTFCTLVSKSCLLQNFKTLFFSRTNTCYKICKYFTTIAKNASLSPIHNVILYALFIRSFCTFLGRVCLKVMH